MFIGTCQTAVRSAFVWLSRCPSAFLPPSPLTRQCRFPPLCTLTNCGLWSRAVAISSASVTHTSIRASVRGTDWGTPWPLHLSTHLVSPTTHPALHNRRPHDPPPHRTTLTTPGPRRSKQTKAAVEDVDTMQTNFQAGGG